MKKVLVVVAAVVPLGVCMAFFGPRVLAHCQIPCGIYDDPTRFKLLAEHIATIEKSMNQINELGAASEKNHNQIVRWVRNKEHHANELIDIVTDYFLAQRVKPVDAGKAEAHKKYVEKLKSLHGLIVSAMKAKQTTDLGHVRALKQHLDAFKGLYADK